MDSPATFGLKAPPTSFDSDSLALFLDLDGTLAPLEVRPELVTVPTSVVTLLGRLASTLDGAVAIVSGRSIDQLDALLSPLRFPTAGLHGGDLRLPNGQTLRFESTSRSADVVGAALQGLALPPGSWVEDKAGICFAVHFRECPDAGAELTEQAGRIAAQTQGEYTVQVGNCVVELKPSGRNKGTAVRRMMESEPFLRRTPIAVGDDHTNEDAFRECRSSGGAAVIVGNRKPTCASYRLESPGAVHAWLAALGDGIEKRSFRQRTLATGRSS